MAAGVAIQFVVPQETREKLKAIAKQENRSVSNLGCYLILSALKKYKGG